MDCKGDAWVIGGLLHAKSPTSDGALILFDSVNLDMRSLCPQSRGLAIPL
jgi:hypothetical protein